MSSTCVRCTCGRELIGETVGSLCSHQWEALCRTVAGVPALVEHLLVQAEPSPQAGGNGARVRVAASGCLYSPARMAADQIHLLLVHCLESACSTLGIRPKPHSRWASATGTGAVQAALIPKLESFAQAPDAISLAGQLYHTCEVNFYCTLPSLRLSFLGRVPTLARGGRCIGSMPAYFVWASDD